MRNAFLALVSLALVGLGVAVLTNASEASPTASLLGQTPETTTTTLDGLDDEQAPDDGGLNDVAVNATIEVALPESLWDGVAEAAECVNASESVSASFTDGLLKIEMTDAALEDIKDVLLDCGLPLGAAGLRDHGFSFDLSPFHGFDGFPFEGSGEFEGFGFRFDRDDFEELHENFEARREAIEACIAGNEEREAVHECLSDLDWDEFGFGFFGFGPDGFEFEFHEEDSVPTTTVPANDT